MPGLRRLLPLSLGDNLTLGIALYILLLLPSAAFAQIECGIFVSSLGADSGICGLSPSDPCRTINHSIARAEIEGLSCVFVQAGSYQENVVLAEGVDLIGGYDASWNYSTWSNSGHRVEIRGGLDPGTNQFWTVKANFISQTTRVSNLVLMGPDAAGTQNSAGRSSYVVHANESTLILEDLRLEAGDASDGLVGANGTSASQSAPAEAAGQNGLNAREYSTSCDTSRRNGGAGGVNPAGVNNSGGVGGKGGQMDTCCTAGVCSLCDCSATSGLAGGSGQNSGGGFGNGGSGGPTCSSGLNGYPGRVQNGSGGLGGAGGAVIGDYWVGDSGNDGSLGLYGGGGGGGGGSGGCDTGIDSYGASGGGGGAGGDRGDGGQGAHPGGSSFGILAVSSTVEVINCEIARGRGGDGGNGGIGGAGQPGGLGGQGGLGDGDSGPGGNGGDGGHGGHGGGGGGGAGGSSYGIYADGSDIFPNNVTYLEGSAGQGGAGGASALTWPDGNPGNPGSDGVVDTVIFAKNSTHLASSRSARKAVCDLGPCLAVDAPTGALTRFFFSQAVPNPASDQTVFQLGLSAPARVRLDLYAVSGRRIRTAVDRELAPGTHSLRMDTNGLASGVYFARLETVGHLETRKVMIVR